MNEHSHQTLSNEKYKEQLAALQKLSTTSTDSCLVAKYIALTDTTVQNMFIERFNNPDYVFKGIYCESGIGIPENINVVCHFECRPGIFCLVPPSFLVIVNIVSGKVVDIIASYPSIEISNSASCGCDGNSSSHSTNTCVSGSKSDCIDVTIKNGKACLKVPYAGDVCISVPRNIPNGTVAEACIDKCYRFNILCGAEVSLRVLGQEVASQSWGCC